jgi:hypothetical protein
MVYKAIYGPKKVFGSKTKGKLIFAYSLLPLAYNLWSFSDNNAYYFGAFVVSLRTILAHKAL